MAGHRPEASPSSAERVPARGDKGGRKRASIQHLAGTGKGRKRPKEGYVCNACGAQGEARHWIFECEVYKAKKAETKAKVKATDKTTDKATDKTTDTPSGAEAGGTEVGEKKVGDHGGAEGALSKPQKRKKRRGKVDPDANPCKVFVSGLPFNYTKGEVEKLFSECGAVTNVRLLLFSGSKKCNGQAFVCYKESVQAQTCIASLNGRELSAESGKRTLKVVAALSRSRTKPKKQRRPGETFVYRAQGAQAVRNAF